MTMNAENYQTIEILDSETLEMLREQTQDNPEILDDIFASFYPEAEELLAEITQTSKEQNMEALRKATHALSGIAGSIGALRLAQVSRDTENAIKATDLSLALKTAPLIAQMYQELKQQLSEI